MKRFFLILLFISAKAIAQDVQGTWSGSMKMDQYWQGITGTSEKHVTLTILDNIVTGTVTGSAKVTIPGTNATSTCSGSGTGQLWRVSLNADGTYDIQGISPKYTCTGSDGSTTEGTEDVLVSSERITNPNSLKGSRTTTLDNSSLGTGNITVTWELNRSIGAQLIIIPENYDTWLPVPGKNEMVAGSTMKVRLELEGKEGRPLNIKSKGFEIKLNNTSKEPGMTINYPVDPMTDLPDIRILPLPNIAVVAKGQEMNITCNNCTTTTITIAAFDGGGYTTLTADAVLDGEIRVRGTLLDPDGITSIPIPKRETGKFIGKYWSDQYGNPDDREDQEHTHDNTNDGDGLTAYEEYRGVISEGSFKRLDPQKKELGVWLTKDESQFFDEGFQWFQNASGVKVIKFIDDEIIFDRNLNRNYKTCHSYDQYAIKVSKGPLDPGVVGRAVHQPGNWGPKSTRVVLIDWSQMQDIYQKWVNEAGPDPLLFSLTDELASTVAHELAHGVDVHHHGPNCTIIHFLTARESSDTIWRIFKSNGTEITTRPFELEQIGSKACQESGDLSCIMAYNPFHKWSYKLGADHAWIFNEVPHLALGKGLCNSGRGTGINAGVLYFGDSPRGNCISQLQLKPNY